MDYKTGLKCTYRALKGLKVVLLKPTGPSHGGGRVSNGKEASGIGSLADGSCSEGVEETGRLEGPVCVHAYLTPSQFSISRYY